MQPHTWRLLNIHELDVLCEVMQKWLPIPLSISLIDMRQREDYLPVYSCLCGRKS